MNLDFSMLTLDRVNAHPKKAGTTGDSGDTSSDRHLRAFDAGDTLGTTGDIADRLPSCPHLSPPCPHFPESEKPFGINVSPLSPLVPTDSRWDAANDDADRVEWFDERAAILEFDAGMSRADAERMAAELLSRVRGQSCA